MPYIGNVSPFESVGTSELKDGSVTAAKIKCCRSKSLLVPALALQVLSEPTQSHQMRT